MRRPIRITVLVASIVAVLAVPLAASAAPIPAASTFTYSKNMHPLGFSPRANTISPFTANSDLAFRGQARLPGQLRRVPDRRHQRTRQPGGAAGLPRLCRQPGRRHRAGRCPGSLLELARAGRGDL